MQSFSKVVRKAANTKVNTGIFLRQTSRGLYKMPECGTQVTAKELDGSEGDNKMHGSGTRVVEMEAGLYMTSNNSTPEKADLEKELAQHKGDSDNLPDCPTQISREDLSRGSSDQECSGGDGGNGGGGKSIALKVGLGVGATVGVGALLVGNLLLPGIGFAAGGIVANSWAASLMSSAAIANGGSIAAGSSIAIAQSIGATGVSLATGAAAGAGAGAAGGVLAKAGEKLTRWAKKKQTNEDAQTQTNTKEDKSTQTE